MVGPHARDRPDRMRTIVYRDKLHTIVKKKKKKDPLRLGRHKSDNDTCLEKIEMSKIKLIFKDKNINFGED